MGLALNINRGVPHQLSAELRGVIKSSPQHLSAITVPSRVSGSFNFRIATIARQRSCPSLHSALVEPRRAVLIPVIGVDRRSACYSRLNWLGFHDGLQEPRL